ncbi:uncharacterized protein LOC124887746 [Capsicum annuum]|uniref:uncharacterized protein LOC124887746 n=1 Tax=Capsicum annuum TaxID=4072 RepID=UPI001FB197BA|nr:uncharacterized protein LOC124887746 [Capsicum annuum]
MTCMSNIAIRHNIQFKIIKSSTTRYSLGCLDNNYMWQFHASKIANSLLFQVTTYEKAHSCSVDFITFDHRNATSKVICDYILELVHDSSNVIIPTFMVDEMRRKYEIIISYNKEWQAIQHAYKVIRGTAEENYNRLPSYLHMKKENNPKMYTNIKRDDENRFQYAFFAYGASIIGWTNYRPIIMIDAIFLKAKYHGFLMIAVSKDGNNNIFSLAFGITDSENNESYNWFFNQLIHVIGVDPIDATTFVVREEGVEYFVNLKSRTCQCLASESSNQEEGWVVCCVFKKKNYHKTLDYQQNSPETENLSFVGGDMFQSTPHADATLLKVALE